MGGFSFPPGISIRDVKGCGTSGMAALDSRTGYILKFHLVTTTNAPVATRREIYQILERSSLSRPSSLLKFHGSTSHGILLEYAELGTVRQYLCGTPQQLIPPSTLLRWAQQAAGALQFMHANEICHGDVSCTNFFLDKSLDLKVGDFTSSSNGSFVTPQDLQDDISDYGSALYEMAMGYVPFPDLHKDEREQRLKQKSFPDLANLELKSVVLRCWDGHYTSFADVLRDINIARKQSQIDPTVSQTSGLAIALDFILLIRAVTPL